MARHGFLFLLLLAGISLPFLVSGYGLEVGWNVLFYMLLAMGCSVSVGYCGLWDMGYGAKIAIGAYVSGMLMQQGVSFWLTLPLSALAGALFAVLSGWPARTLRGDYFAMVTLGIGEMVRILLRNLPITGGAQGLNGLPRPSLWGMPLTKGIHWYFLFLGLALLFALFLQRLEHSRLGLEFRCIREDEDAAAAMGIPVMKRKLMAYGISSVLGTLTGSFFAAKMTAVTPTTFTFQFSANILLAVVLGGSGHYQGAMLGGAFFVLLPELFRFLGEGRILLFGILLILVMIFCPEGLWGLLRSWKQKT